MDDLLKLTTKLMHFKTTSDQTDELKKCADFIEGYLKGQGIIIKRYEKRERPSLVALFEDTKKPEVFLNAHFDVVPASPHFFEPKIEGNKLFGRGSEDCKSQVAVLMAVMKYFSKQKSKPSLGLMLTGDEETGGRNGVQYLLSEKGYSSKFALVGDGGDNFDIVTKHKGILHVRVSAIGKSAHSSMYWEGGENAIEKLMQAYPEILKLFPKLTKAEWKSTANLAKIRGGDIMNQVPDYAELYLDIRRTEEYSEDQILDMLGKIKNVQIERIMSASMLESNENNPYANKLKAAVNKILKKTPKFSYEHGATDARYFSEHAIPAVVFKALGYGPHSDTEHLIISSLEPYYAILVEFINSSVGKIK